MIIISLLMYVSYTKWLVQLLKLVIFILNKLAKWVIDKGGRLNGLREGDKIKVFSGGDQIDGIGIFIRIEDGFLIWFLGIIM
ncbi:hypothetical protein FOC93_02935 (plasmid) [Bacillus cereus]|uniref:hypothetical protein n=1 Tax=Bacillus cereus TaxID=1396 RepID=UPI0015607FBB|nr:hypothetical protein [Bacillus cereus]QKH04952.1 hypothetical protein FOC93_02935 [Bacillus cereus]QKH10772.1 hypothetical protein FOC92_01850 [Bacillus cereus]